MLFEEGKSPQEMIKYLKSKLTGLFLSLIILCSLVYLINSLNAYEAKNNAKETPSVSPTTAAGAESLKFRDGDIIFQEGDGERSKHIAAVTESSVTHCGLIIIDKNRVMVLEADDKVVKTPIEEFIACGKDKKFALARIEDLPEDKASKIIKEGMKYLDQPYDNKYQWDDEYLYCSELVYKAYQKGAGIELCPFVKLGDLKYRGHEEYMGKIMGGAPSLDLKMITPAGIFKSEKLNMIYNDFRN